MKPVVRPSGEEKGEAHSLFRLTAANDGQLPVNMYVDLDVNLWELKVPDVRFLITKDPNSILDEKYQIKMPRVVAWKLIRLAFNAFAARYGTSVFDSFQCHQCMKPLLFSQLHILFYGFVQDLGN